ncbi:MAG: isopropylmalate synthase, partial [Methanocellales archaeon]|nr:isopropylmalate synthase [Methanocellales archaeon]
VKLLKDLGVKDIETHVHDDFGLGLTNTLAGYWYGANWSNLTFLGIGERAGNTEIEKLLIFLICRVGGFQKYNPASLVKFAEYMENEIGIRVPRNKAIVGKNVFAHESGIHTAGIIKNPFTYEPFPPELVGGKRQLMIGDSSGTEVIRYKVEETLKELMHLNLSIDKNDSRIQSIKSDIQKLYDDESRVSCISDEELRAYAEKYFLLETIVEKDISKKEE